MEVLAWDGLPVVFKLGEAEIRSCDVGGMAVTFYRLPADTDARPILEGLPGRSCHCPHWGYVISGRLRIHTSSGDAHDVEAGQGFYVEPGHAPETLEATQMFEVSPLQEAREVWEYLEAFLDQSRSDQADD